MAIKKHIAQREYHSWAETFPLFEPLSAAEKASYSANAQQFRLEFPDVRLFPDPFLSTALRPIPIASLADALIVTGAGETERRLAATLHDCIAAEHGILLPIIADTEERDLRARAEPVIFIGGTHRNRRSRELAQALQLGVFNRDFPGASGWGVTAYQGIEADQGTRFVLAANEENSAAALEYFLQNAVVPGEVPQLRWTHRVQLDPQLPAPFHDFDLWLQQQPATPLEALNDWRLSDHKRPYRELFEEILLPMRNGPVLYNAALLDTGVTALRYYQLTGNEKALHLFRETLRGFWEYLQSDDPNIYISDMDFRLGQLCAAWSWAEFHPAITDEERRIFPRLLLGAMRMVHAYYLQNWSTRSLPPGVRHNHQTFKARCLLYGWRYFRQFQVEDAAAWKRDADALFAGMDAARTKYAENANKYEAFAPEHLLAWHEVTNREIGPEFQRALAAFARREWALTDNFFYRVEYGDCDVSFRKARPFQAAPWLDVTNPDFTEIIALERSTSDLFPPEIPAAIYSFGPLSGEPGSAGFHHLMTGWTRIALEPKLRELCALAGPGAKWFDKLAWRSGWKDDSSYLALEGFGNETVSHAHNAANSIIRANCGGRVWLVGNGYGKKIGVTQASEAFATRERGPVDHNMLILRDADDHIITPPVNALLADCGTAPLPFAITELPAYGGCRWLRHTFLLAEVGWIVIDAVTAYESTLSHDITLEWNVLGEALPATFGGTFNQAGVRLEFHHFSTAQAHWDHNASASWHRALQNAEYPHTSHPLRKCVLSPTWGNISEREYHFVSGFWLDGEVRAAHWNPATLSLEIQTRRPLFGAAEYSATWGDVEAGENFLRIELQRAPEIAG